MSSVKYHNPYFGPMLFVNCDPKVDAVFPLIILINVDLATCGNRFAIMGKIV